MWLWKNKDKNLPTQKEAACASQIFQTTSRYTSSCWGRQVIEILFILTPEVNRRERSFKNYWRILICRMIRTLGIHNKKEGKRGKGI